MLYLKWIVMLFLTLGFSHKIVATIFSHLNKYKMRLTSALEDRAIGLNKLDMSATLTLVDLRGDIRFGGHRYHKLKGKISR